MSESLRVRAGHLISQYRFRKSRQRVISFSGKFARARSAMVILPFENNEADQYHAVTSFLIDRFNGQDITIVSADHAVEVMRLLPRSTIIHFRRDELNPVFLPRKELHDRLLARAADVTIDLNLDFLLPSAYICRATGAGIRIGFSRRFAEPYYNLLVRPDPTLSRTMVYDRLAQFLRKF